MGANGFDGRCEVPVGRKEVRCVELIAFGHDDEINGKHYVHSLFNHGKTTLVISSDRH